MPEESAPPPQTPATKKKKKVSGKTKRIFLDIIARKRLTDRPDFNAIAQRHGVHAGTVRRYWFEWKNGLVDLGEPDTPEERHFNALDHHRHKLGVFQRYEALLLVDFERSVLLAEDLMTKGHKKEDGPAFAVARCPEIMRELLKCQDGVRECEKGYAAVLDEEANRRRGLEKPVGPAASQDVQTEVVAVSEEERAMRALDASQ